jgi:hypothetical protein
MPLSDSELALLTHAATISDPTRRRQAVVTVLSKRGPEENEARALLGLSFLSVTQPSFHLIPRGTAMASQGEFTSAYDDLAAATANFAVADTATLTRAVLAAPRALIPLRMIAGLTHNELAVAMKLVDPGSTTSGATLKKFERSPAPNGVTAKREALVKTAVEAIRAVLNRQILTVPEDAAGNFHSKIDREDTRDGWLSVNDAAVHGVPYSALLYHRYVGGAWRQVQDAYSEIKGDNILEVPLEQLLISEKIPYYRTPSGASGAADAARRFGLNPGPDFVIPEHEPAVIIESKVAEDGGTARDKAARIQALAIAGRRAGLAVCALVDGKGWGERPSALVDVVIATEGRTYSLSTLMQILAVSEIASVRGTSLT